MDMKKAVLIQSLILGTAFALPVSAVMERPTVADCVERTGKTEADCKEMLSRFGKDSRPPEGSLPEDVPKPSNVDDIERIEKPSERVAKMKTDRERRYVRMQERMGKIIAYLDSESVDTSAAKGYLETFKAKVTDILGAYDTYRAALEAYENDGSVGNKAAVVSSKESLRTRIIDTSEYYRSTVMPALRSLIDLVAE
jgi:hypothetical protein